MGVIVDKCHPSLQGIPKVKLSGEEFVASLLDRRWTLPKPDTKIQQIMLSSKKVTHPFLEMIEKESQEPSFYVLRDDLLHPLVNGNKSRKLDALFPLVEDHLVTDVVSFKFFYLKLGSRLSL